MAGLSALHSLLTRPATARTECRSVPDKHANAHEGARENEREDEREDAQEDADEEAYENEYGHVRGGGRNSVTPIDVQP
ncbi:hypothetical protein FHS42_000788 [Streptomyces zagrosensis]|uniref:Uncharacterized protein n=1 Tax=Streptomyces zagrosensis TaxID=1042984 RepID=A0A7W9Q6S0_9ACTN|nr:hypothetical protein [Streptomyces zagrosensis]